MTSGSNILERWKSFLLVYFSHTICNFEKLKSCPFSFVSRLKSSKCLNLSPWGKLLQPLSHLAILFWTFSSSIGSFLKCRDQNCTQYSRYPIYAKPLWYWHLYSHSFFLIILNVLLAFFYSRCTLIDTFTAYHYSSSLISHCWFRCHPNDAGH